VLGVGSHGPLGPAPAPPSPVVDRDERLAWLAMASVVRLEPPAYFALVKAHGSARAVLAAARRGGAALAAPGVNDASSLAALLATATERVEAIDREVARLGLAVVTVDDAGYPARLRRIDLAPPVLLVHGDVGSLEAERSVAVVGTRRPTEAGRLTAARIGGALARTGTVVVSGLAVGIDGAAHAASVASGAPTIAVIAGGHDRVYPMAHQRLAREIVAAGGAIVSEMTPGTPPRGAYFIRRNRLIAGLADATVVVEAGVRSGALATARWALEQGRECFLVPGPIDEPASSGCLAFLRRNPGATRIVAGVSELLDDLGIVEAERGPRAERVATVVQAELGRTEAAVARQMARGRTSVDEISLAAGLPVATVLGALTMLEMRGMVAGVYGRYRLTGRLAAAPDRG
jgi:DNA processing protein